MFSLAQCNWSYHCRAKSFKKTSIWHKYIFTHRPPAAHNSTLIRLEDEAFSPKPSKLWFTEAQRGFTANFPASCTGVSCPAPHTIKTKADLKSLTAAILYRDIKKNGAGIVYNTGSWGYLNTKNIARTQKSADTASLHLPKAHSTRTILQDPKP